MEKRKRMLPYLLLVGGMAALLLAAVVLWMLLRTAPDTAGLILVWLPAVGRGWL